MRSADGVPGFHFVPSGLRKLALLAAILLAPAAWAQPGETLEAATAAGEKVLLHPNGRWEYMNAAKRAEAQKIAEQYPENKLRPEGAQGGVFGIGRTILPGDKDYNRGSLNPKMR